MTIIELIAPVTAASLTYYSEVVKDGKTIRFAAKTYEELDEYKKAISEGTRKSDIYLHHTHQSPIDGAEVIYQVEIIAETITQIKQLIKAFDEVHLKKEE